MASEDVVVNVFQAEKCFLLGAALILVGFYGYLPQVSADAQRCAWLFVVAAVAFWSLTMRGLSLLFRGVGLSMAEHEAGGQPTARRNMLVGALLKAIAVGGIVAMFLRFGACGAKWFTFATIAYLFLGSFFLVTVAAITKKNK